MEGVLYMIKPCVLVTWPCHVDFPLFRYNLRRFRPYFKDVFVAFTNEGQSINYRQWVINNLPFAQFTKPFYNKDDWRNDTVNALLTLVTDAEYYLFMEQDFLVNSASFWDTVLTTTEPFLYYKEDQRIHQAFALVRRDLVERTSKDFSAYPDQGMDHFGKFFKELGELHEGVDIRTLGVKEKEDFYHLAGTTQNYYCFDHDQPFYKPDEFLEYNYLSMLMPKQNPDFYLRQVAISEKHSDFSKTSFISRFFPKEK